MTYAETLACKMWAKHYEHWRANPERKLHELRKKPPKYDLWEQGDNPLALEATKASPTLLVPEDWTSTAKPVPLPAVIHEQPPLL